MSVTLAALAVVVVSIAPLLATSARADSTAPAPGFRLAAQLPIGTLGTPGAIGGNQRSMLLDPIHRRAYTYQLYNGDELLFFRYDIDAITGGLVQQAGPPITIQDFNQVNAGGSNAYSYGFEGVMSIDPTASRLFYSAEGEVYEVETDTSDPAHFNPNNPVVHAWDAKNIDAANALGSRGANVFNDAFHPAGMWYDPGEVDANGVTLHSQMLYMVGESGVGQGGQEAKGVEFVGLDAHHDPQEPAGDYASPQDRFKWVYVARSCSTIGDGINSQAMVFRSGDWLYTFCDAYGDATTKGVLRVKLTTSGLGSPGNPQPDPTTEQFFPGVTGTDVKATGDPVAGRVYVANTTVSGRAILVFDGQASKGLGAYTGEIALTQSASHTIAGLDPGTGRWYFQSPEGLSYQDGRLRRVAQANNFDNALDVKGNNVTVSGYTSPNPKPVVVDPALLDAGGNVVRPARLYVYRDGSEHGCPVAGQPCYEVFEDTSPLPGLPPPPTEATLNKPEGPGLAGVYDGVTSAYGVRLRVMRGLSTAWPAGVPGSPPGSLSLEQAPAHNPPQSPFDYGTDPFYYYGGACGSNDREVTFGRVRQVQLHGDLFNQDASAVAVPVDPDVIRPSAPTDKQTRNDVQSPDQCTIGLLQTMSNPIPVPGQVWSGLGPPLAKAGQGWPYPTTSCAGNDTPDAVGGSFQGLAPATAQVQCGATADQPTSQAQTYAQLSPTGFPVSVQSTSTSTQIVRHPGQGIETKATSVVKGIDINGVVHLDEMIVTASATAKGYANAQGTTAHGDVTRQFLGLTVAGQQQCVSSCDPKQVVDAINLALGGTGYARAADPEADVTQGTVKGTLAVVQKDQLLQDSDGITNDDFSTEWPGLEIVLYRDGTARGRGRWEVQLGGVFAQSEFGVVTALANQQNSTQGFGNGSGGSWQSGHPAVPARSVPGTTRPAVAGTPPHQVVVANDVTPIAATAPQASAGTTGGVVQQIAHGVERSIKAALLLLALWALVYAPAYVARRRQFLSEVMNRW